MYKKGELTTQQIVILIILIASFAVILFFLLRLNLGQQNAQQICHNSVITRGSSIVSADAFPLKCQRQYVCLSFDGTCEKMTKPDVIKVKTKDDVYKALADQMAECWWMFGEGKVDYVGKDTTPTLYCSICSQIAFDNSVVPMFNSGTLNRTDLYHYMANNKYSSGQTYLEYLYKTNKIDASKLGFLDLTKQYYTLMGIRSKTSKLTWALIGGATFVVGALTGGAGWVIGGIAFAAGGGSGYFLAPVVQGGSENYFVSPLLVEPGSPEFNALKCEDIKTSS